ncbi:hypothetical protein AB5N19_13923 [Seiridium cardinale]
MATAFSIAGFFTGRFGGLTTTQPFVSGYGTVVDTSLGDESIMSNDEKMLVGQQSVACRVLRDVLDFARRAKLPQVFHMIRDKSYTEQQNKRKMSVFSSPARLSPSLGI